MASHGVPRSEGKQERTAEAREKDLKQIKEYRDLVEYVQSRVAEKDFSPELLEKTGALLQRNPEYYTIWNTRRQIYVNEFDNIERAAESNELTQDAKVKQFLDIIQLDLQFLFPLLLKFPKCYWIWNHRIWLLQQSSLRLPVEKARQIWNEELSLVGKMLTRDRRNYHGWGYRRFIISNLESSGLQGQSMARQEYEYTTKMIGNDLSNFSAWHNRTKLILRFLDEEQADGEERRRVLQEELALIHKALFDPYDQSLWFYHQTLLSALDPHRCHKSMVPDLSREEQGALVAKEKEFLEDILEDADDCKWVYQALIDCTAIHGRLNDGLTLDDKADIAKWLAKLKHLDPLRQGRWKDMESQIA